MLTFGQRVRQLRRANSLTIRQVADAIRRDFTYVSKIENDRVLPPSAEVIVSMATLLGTDPEELAILGDKPPTRVVRQQLAEQRSANQRLREQLRIATDQLQAFSDQGCERYPGEMGTFAHDALIQMSVVE